jgi:hypothetical protein
MKTIANILKGQTITYGRIVIDYRPQKADSNRVRINAGGNLIKDYPGELTTRTADLTTLKIMWNSVLSTEGACFMGVDIKSFYLTLIRTHENAIRHFPRTHHSAICPA